RIVFKEPVVRVQMEKIRFPKLCPICGSPATKPARISTAPAKKQYLRPQWDPAFSPAVRRSMGLKVPEVKTLLLQVCEDHFKSDEGDTNYKVLCLLVNAILAAAFVFASLMIGNRLWIGLPVDPVLYLVVLSLPLSILATIFAFRSGPLASSVRIIGFDSGLMNVWLEFARPDYRDAFMEENSMNAELVQWIVKS
ncbi:MAG: hypothetical protein ACFFDR_08810, partial [Candidatus Thorarchaeota archaeon]